MVATNSAVEPQTDREVLITRLINAPRELVFEAWIDEQHMVNWYAPLGCTLTIKHMDVRPGGRFHTCIANPAFGQCWCVGTYLEVVPPERIVFSMTTANEQGDIIDPVAAGHDPRWPAETVVTVTFEDQNGKTLLTLHQTVSEELAKHTGAHPSWLQMLDRLERVLQAPI